MAEKVTVSDDAVKADTVQVNTVEETANGIEAVAEIAAHSKTLNNEVSDEFCTNEEYAEKSLIETPCTTFRYIIKMLL